MNTEINKIIRNRRSVFPVQFNGEKIEDSIILAEKLGNHGVDVIGCSAGGISGAPMFRLNKQNKPIKYDY